jgi:hypothetical protein
MGLAKFTQDRLAAAGGVALSIACGLWLRKGIGGEFGEHAGNVAWGVMWTWIVLGVAPLARLRVVAAVATAIVFGIEFFQLTPWPARWSEASIVAGYLVGGRFEWHDLVGGAIGIGLATAMVAWMRAKATGGFAGPEPRLLD